MHKSACPLWFMLFICMLVTFFVKMWAKKAFWGWTGVLTTRGTGPIIEAMKTLIPILLICLMTETWAQATRETDESALIARWVEDVLAIQYRGMAPSQEEIDRAQLAAAALQSRTEKVADWVFAQMDLEAKKGPTPGALHPIGWMGIILDLLDPRHVLRIEDRFFRTGSLQHRTLATLCLREVRPHAEVAEMIQGLLNREESTQVRSLLLSALSNQSPGSDPSSFQTALDHPAPEMRRAAIDHFWHHWDARVLSAMQNRMRLEADPQALKILTWVLVDRGPDPPLTWLGHPRVEVRRAMWDRLLGKSWKDTELEAIALALDREEDDEVLGHLTRVLVNQAPGQRLRLLGHPRVAVLRHTLQKMSAFNPTELDLLEARLSGLNDPSLACALGRVLFHHSPSLRSEIMTHERLELRIAALLEIDEEIWHGNQMKKKPPRAVVTHINKQLRQAENPALRCHLARCLFSLRDLRCLDIMAAYLGRAEVIPLANPRPDLSLANTTLCEEAEFAFYHWVDRLFDLSDPYSRSYEPGDPCRNSAWMSRWFKDQRLRLHWTSQGTITDSKQF